MYLLSSVPNPDYRPLDEINAWTDEIAIAMYARIDSVVWILPGMPP